MNNLGLLSLQILNKLGRSFASEAVHSYVNEFSKMVDLPIDLVALIAHGISKSGDRRWYPARKTADSDKGSISSSCY